MNDDEDFTLDTRTHSFFLNEVTEEGE